MAIMDRIEGRGETQEDGHEKHYNIARKIVFVFLIS